MSKFAKWSAFRWWLLLTTMVATLNDVPCHGQDLNDASGLTVRILWKHVEGGVQPLFDGLPSPSESPEFREGATDPLPRSLFNAVAAADTFDVQISPSGENCPPPTALSPSMYGKIVKKMGVRCKACVERQHYVEAAQTYLSNLSIRSLKNMLAVRGVSCKACRTRQDLEMGALHAITLEPKNVTLPLFDTGSGNPVRCYPRSFVLLKVVEPRHRVLVERALASNRRFALRQRKDTVALAKILEQGETAGNMWVKIRCDQRVRVLGTEVDPNSHGLAYATGLLMVDDPISKSQAPQLGALATRVRRLFFALDADSFAEARAQALVGNPPEERQGPEVLSHWISQAVSTPRMHSTLAQLDLADFLVATTNTSMRLEALDHFLSRASVFQGVRLCGSWSLVSSSSPAPQPKP
jgi:hypothetical protein